MGRMKTNESKVAAAQSQSVSIRTTIPAHVAGILDLKPGDTLKWEVDKDGEQWIATIRKDEIKSA